MPCHTLEGDKKVIEEEQTSGELKGKEATRFRAVAARANYLSADRPDIQYAVKEVCRRMAKPVKSDWQKLVRLARYLKGAPRLVWEYHWQSDGGEPQVLRERLQVYLPVAITISIGQAIGEAAKVRVEELACEASTS